jgi:hypothetical protein
MTVALVPRLLCCDPDDLDVSIFLAGVKVEMRQEIIAGAPRTGRNSTRRSSFLCTLLGRHLLST